MAPLKTKMKTLKSLTVKVMAVQSPKVTTSKTMKVSHLILVKKVLVAV